MKLDLHVHTRERSPCARDPEVAVVEAAIAAGLEAIAITDHHRLCPAASLARLNAAYAPFRIYGGIELAVEGEDFVVLGSADPVLETTAWTYRDLHTFVRARGAFIFLAHPYRFRPELLLPLANLPPDGIEIASPHTPPAAQDAIAELAATLNLVTLSNSDTHRVEMLGSHYNLGPARPDDEGKLLRLLRAAQFAPVHRRPDGTVRNLPRGRPPA